MILFLFSASEKLGALLIYYCNVTIQSCCQHFTPSWEGMLPGSGSSSSSSCWLKAVSCCLRSVAQSCIHAQCVSQWGQKELEVKDCSSRSPGCSAPSHAGLGQLIFLWIGPVVKGFGSESILPPWNEKEEKRRSPFNPCLPCQGFFFFFQLCSIFKLTKPSHRDPPSSL